MLASGPVLSKQTRCNGNITKTYLTTVFQFIS